MYLILIFVDLSFIKNLPAKRFPLFMIGPKKAPFVHSSPESFAIFCCQNLHPCNSWVREPKGNTTKLSVKAHSSTVNCMWNVASGCTCSRLLEAPRLLPMFMCICFPLGNTPKAYSVLSICGVHGLNY